MSAHIEVTETVRKILDVLLVDDRELTALKICQRAELGPGTIHPHLARLERGGWVASSWESREPMRGRARRRFYGLTPRGRAAAHQVEQSVPDSEDRR